MSLENFFNGKSVLVTGASKGIGRALTERLHGYGAKVYAVSRSKALLQSLEKECPNVIPIQLDIGANWEETKKVVEGMKDLDVVINNAATVGDMIPFLETTEAHFDSHSDVNLKALVIISQTAANNWIARKKKGSIVNISSIAALRVLEYSSMYCSNKAGIDMLTKCMASELGKHYIRVNSINLGFVKTSIIDRMVDTIPGGEEGVKEFMKPVFPKVVYGNDWLPMDDALNTILFTASDLANTLTGSCIVMDGGYTTS